ncbi:hypothetical protein ACFFS2_25610 [Streptomyces aurantiacus]|uniref:DUF3558 domain-containing protein n=1 Tax=Streptomyces aurantiacus TaxID=47760 RepID=A0A7G1PGK3_9ACTN|nr:hypothetical protein [Streptomyces aurantiacus]BCL33026.1 hypothetical protein GCM10017557_78850 [Streptomyces aurantiacus]
MQDRPEDVPAQPEPQAPPPADSATPPDPATPPSSATAPASPPTPENQSQAHHQPSPSAPPRPEPAPPGPYASPQPANNYGPPPAYPPAQQYAYGQPSGFPPPPGRKGTAGRAVLWAAVGAVVASALWAGGIFLFDPLGDDPELAGYRAKSNLCSSVDYSTLRDEYAEKDDSPTHNSLKHKAIDQSYCSISLKTTSSSSYADAYLSVQMDLHKKTDPAAEFTALWSEYHQRYEDYEVEEVSGFGDEAYLVTEDTTSGSAATSGSRSVILAVRDGWMTYQMSWSVYTSSYESTTPPEVGEVSRWVKSDTRSTLENLRTD